MLKKFFLIFYFIGLLAFPVFVLAQTPATTEATKGDSITTGIKFKPSIYIPNSIFTKEIIVDGGTLAKYIVAVYRYGGIFAGVVAMFMLVYAGWEWLLAGGNSSKISGAKNKISATLIGLALLFGGYILLSLISSNLIKFNSLNTTLPKLETECPKIDQKDTCKRAGCLWVPASAEQLRANETITDYCVAPLAVTCPSEGELQDVNITGLAESNCTDCRLPIDTINKLKKAVDMLNPNESMTIKSAYRSFAKQQELYDCYNEMLANNGRCPARASCSDGCQEASKPDCEKSTHMMGVAVDVCIDTPDFNTCGRDSYGKSFLQKKYNCQSARSCAPGMWAAQQALKTVMVGACFSPYEGPRGEWWHFVANPGPCS